MSMAPGGRIAVGFCAMSGGVPPQGDLRGAVAEVAEGGGVGGAGGAAFGDDGGDEVGGGDVEGGVVDVDVGRGRFVGRGLG